MAEEAAPTKPQSRAPLIVGLVVGLAVLEAAGFYIAAQFFGGGPQVTHGEEGQHLIEQGEAPGPQPMAEVYLLKRFKVPNNKDGRLKIYDVDILVKVPQTRAEEMKTLAESHEGELSDTVARIIRAADPRVLQEPELATLRVQLQHAFSASFDDAELFNKVLIPRCVPLSVE